MVLDVRTFHPVMNLNSLFADILFAGCYYWEHLLRLLLAKNQEQSRRVIDPKSRVSSPCHLHRN